MWTTCSRTFDTMGSKDIGRWLLMTRVSFVLGTGTIFACFDPVGTFPKVNDLLNNSVRYGAITSAHSFSNLADIPSGPVAFHTDSADNRLRTERTGRSEYPRWRI